MFNPVWDMLKEAFGSAYLWFASLFDAFDVWHIYIGLIFTICIFRFFILPAFQDGNYSDDDKKSKG